MLPRYLFSAHSNEYLSETRSHGVIASICTKYLSSNCFSTELSDEAILDRLLSGSYVLESFACTSWLYHVEQACSHEEKELLPCVSGLLTQRVNTSYAGSGCPTDDKLAPFRNSAPDVHARLLEIKAFLRKRWDDFCFISGRTALLHSSQCS